VKIQNSHKEIKTDTTSIEIENNNTGLLGHILEYSNKFKRLLKYIKIYDESFIHNSNYSTIQICSDGGTRDNKGSFGLFLYSNKQLILTVHIVECLQFMKT
jgi:hypothetical protein